MKIRNGFVSNSSSSSFIVVFNKKPENIEELNEMMFNNGIDDIFVGNTWNNNYPNKEIVSKVFDEIDDISMAKDDIFNFFENSSRYYYWGSNFSGEGELYFATDEKLTEKLRELYIEKDKFEKLEAKFKDLSDKEITKDVEKELGYSRPKYNEDNYNVFHNKFDDMKKGNKNFKYFLYYNDIMRDFDVKLNEIEQMANLNDSEQFYNDHKDSHICSFEFSDNSGDLESLLEHSDIFNKLPNIRISNH
jgi:hypothetical protein